MESGDQPALPSHGPVEDRPPRKPRQCENCHSGQHALQSFRIDGQGTFWRCTTCGLFQKGFPVPSQVYDFDYHSHYLRSRARKVRTAADRLDQLTGMITQRSPRLLDIGSSIGAVLEAAEQRGWRAYGVDVSREAVHHCRDRGHSCQHYDGFKLPFPSKFFDIVTAWHVIEHVPCVRTSLDEWLRVLCPGGILAIETPAADCWKARLLGTRYRKFWPAEHTYTFTRQTLEPFLWDAGFEVVTAPLTIPGGSRSGTLRATIRRMQLGLARCIGASKSFMIFAQRASNRSLDLQPWRAG